MKSDLEPVGPVESNNAQPKSSLEDLAIKAGKTWQEAKSITAHGLTSVPAVAASLGWLVGLTSAYGNRLPWEQALTHAATHGVVIGAVAAGVALTVAACAKSSVKSVQEEIRQALPEDKARSDFLAAATQNPHLIEGEGKKTVAERIDAITKKAKEFANDFSYSAFYGSVAAAASIGLTGAAVYLHSLNTLGGVAGLIPAVVGAAALGATALAHGVNHVRARDQLGQANEAIGMLQKQADPSLAAGENAMQEFKPVSPSTMAFIKRVMIGTREDDPENSAGRKFKPG